MTPEVSMTPEVPLAIWILLSLAGSAILLLLGGWTWMLAWGFKRWVKRVDTIEREKANKASTDARFEQLTAAIEKHMDDDHQVHREISASIKETNAELQKANVALATIAAKNDL